jgi:cell division septation protein DedD
MTPPTDADDDFREEIESWLQQELAPPPRTLVRSQERGSRTNPEPTGPAAYESSTAGAATHDYRSERYLQRLWRKWRKGALMGVGVFVAITAVASGASLLSATRTAVVMPAVPAAPTAPLPGLVLPNAPTPDGSVPDPALPAVEEMNYFVAVGLFASRDRSDELVAALAGMGLPAMQRAVDFHRRPVQQIVLGPYYSRSDALADLRRLQQLGGYDDASVIHDSPTPAAQSRAAQP